MLNRSSIIVFVVCSGVYRTIFSAFPLVRRPSNLPQSWGPYWISKPSPIPITNVTYQLYSHLVYRIPYPTALLLVLNCFMWY